MAICFGRSRCGLSLSAAMFLCASLSWAAPDPSNISENTSPATSVAQFREPTLWKQYRWPILAVVVSLGETALILGLFVKLRRSKRLMRESTESFHQVAISAPVMLWVSDCNKLCTYFNDAWLAFTGRSMEQELGNGWAEGVHPEDIDRCLSIYTEAFDKRERFQMEYRLRRHDGEFRTILDVGVPKVTPEGVFSGYIGSAIDVTEQKIAQAALSGLSHRLMGAQEEERARIARELHDDFCQRLISVSIQLHVFGESLPSSATGMRVRVQDFSRQVGDIARGVQGISYQLHSIKLQQLGLVSAAADLCREVSEQRSVTIDFSHRDVPDSLPKDVALALFRVLQEALTNAAKHSRARCFSVALDVSWDEIHLEVIDDGIGFEPQAITSGLGLISMRERLRLVNGDVVVESGPGTGTRICARVPLPELSMLAERSSLLF